MGEEEVLFYGEMSNFSVASFILRMNEMQRQRKDVKIPLNSMGGDADAGWGVIKTVRDYPFQTMMSVHGAAYSMMAFALIFANNNECVEQSQFLFHRAASFFEDESTTLQKLLVERNITLRKAIEDSLDVDAFERIGGVTLDEMFDMSDRKDAIFNAEEAEEIKLIKNVLPLSSNEAKDLNEAMMAASAGAGIFKLDVDKFSHTMELKELQSKHPELYKKIKEDAKTEAEAAIKEEEKPKTPATETPKELTAKQVLQQERDRVAAWNVFAEVDPEAVTKGIASGEAITTAATQEFLLKSTKKTFGKNLEKDGKKIETPEASGESLNTKSLQKMEASVRKGLGLKEAPFAIESSVEDNEEVAA